mgnify:CR=1 FL=1
MKSLIQIVLMISLPFVFFSCDSSNEPQTNDFIKGDVSFGLKSSVTFEQIIDNVFTIEEIQTIKAGLYNSSTQFPEDSLHFIESTFYQLDFIDTALTTIKYSDNNNWLLNIGIRGFNENNIVKWYDLQSQFNMNPISTYKIYGLFKVEEGKESYCIDRLKETGLFDWLDYNYVANISH